MESVAAVAGMILFYAGLLAGFAIIPFGLPGTFVIAGVALLHGLLTSFEPLTFGSLAILFALAVSAEVIEFLSSAAATRRFGGSRQAMWAAVIGGLGGAILGTPILPVLGTLAGAFAGAFVGATIMDFNVHQDRDKALKAGFGALIGAVSGKLLKLTIALTMIVMITARIF